MIGTNSTSPNLCELGNDHQMEDEVQTENKEQREAQDMNSLDQAETHWNNFSLSESNLIITSVQDREADILWGRFSWWIDVYFL